MTIIFNRDGISLPVSQALLILLSQEAERTELDLNRSISTSSTGSTQCWAGDRYGWQRREICSRCGNATSSPTAGWSASASPSAGTRKYR